MALLEISGLQAGFHGDDGYLRVLDGINLTLEAGATLGLVGESGCGKSVTALSVMRLLPQPAGRIESGSIVFDGVDLAALPAAALPSVRGRRISMIFQEPMTALNPVHRIGKQLFEVMALHAPDESDTQRRRRALDLLDRVGIPEAEQRLLDYPHQLSGGMRQRIVIAIALANSPELLIADEPTTALDVTIQAQILDLLRELQRDTGMAMLFITHDLGVVAQLCDDVTVMYAGRIAEQAPVRELFARPCHPYTRGLLASIPRLDDEPKTELTIIAGTVPGLVDMPPGCRFANRCAHADRVCGETPALSSAGAGHGVACHHWRAASATAGAGASG